MRKLRLYISILLITSLTILTGCLDEGVYNPLGKGTCQISAEFNFKNFSDTGLGTRASGDRYDKIRNLAVLFYNNDGELLEPYCQYVDFTDSQINSGDDYDDRKGLNFSVPYGRYRIYAVANMGDILATHSSQAATEAGLKSIELTWNGNNNSDTELGQNDQMLGVFRLDNTYSDELDAPLLTVNKQQISLHAWLVRAASKVTVAFDGSRLKEGVTIYIKSLAIKKIAKSCFLGDSSKVTSESGYIFNGGGFNYPAQTNVTKKNPFYPPKTGGTEEDPEWSETDGPHAHTSKNALFFYENMQGTGPSRELIDENENKELDPEERFEFEEMPYATYIEVDAEFVSINEERPGRGKIIYRYMLGNGSQTNFDARRNHAYRLTLRFNGFANDYDWHMDLEKFLLVPPPAAVNYRGLAFYSSGWEDKNGNLVGNLGNNYDINKITVTSFEQNIATGEKTFLPITKISYVDNKTLDDVESLTDADFKETLPEWLTKVDTTSRRSSFEVDFAFTYRDYTNKVSYSEFEIKDSINSKTIGNSATPYNLAGSTATSTTADNTANCYVVSNKGYYIIPLVYGNARENGSDNKLSYSGFENNSANSVLTTFVNYNNDPISDPYILTDIYKNTIPTGITASIVWEDEQNLVTNVEYVPTAYGNKGGIKFEVGEVNNGGNAVIAIKDPSGIIMWSWHIWVTYSKFTEEWTNDIYYDYVWPGGYSYKIMPVDIGWCPLAEEKVKYYPERRCLMKVENGTLSEIVEIVQKPHLAVTAGNITYFQWGRKDPFWGALAANETNKTHWVVDRNGSNLTMSTGNPDVINPIIPGTDEGGHTTRPLTKNNLKNLIRHPQLWNDPRCKENPNSTTDFDKWLSNDSIYTNLWTPLRKTVYDPCPYGYKVPRLTTFSGYAHWDSSTPNEFFVALKKNMLTGYIDNLVYFYINTDKLVSSTYSELGYRDYDHTGDVYRFKEGYEWTCEYGNNPWVADTSVDKCRYFRYQINYTSDDSYTGVIVPGDAFFSSDGMAVRPTKEVPIPVTESRRRR